MIYVEIIASVGPGPHLRPGDSQKLTLRRKSSVFVKVQLRKATSGSGCVCVCVCSVERWLILTLI